MPALSDGIPFALDDTVTMFQVFPVGTSQNAMGNACDQVIVFGRLGIGSVRDGNIESSLRSINNNICAGRREKDWAKAIAMPWFY